MLKDKDIIQTLHSVDRTLNALKTPLEALCVLMLAKELYPANTIRSLVEQYQSLNKSHRGAIEKCTEFTDRLQSEDGCKSHEERVSKFGKEGADRVQERLKPHHQFISDTYNAVMKFEGEHPLIKRLSHFEQVLGKALHDH